MMETTTIASVATPVGQGALSVIRMSGPDCLAVLERCAHLPKDWQPRRVTLTDIVASDGQVIDQVLATWFRGPASYTGEDSVEVSCHGGMLVTRRVLERLFACGASPAEPGEFTKRAFLNGRMDLTQAEAVMDIISAGSDLALKAAQEQLNGAIGHVVSQLAEDLIHLVAHVEAYIDFPEEDITPDTVGQMTRSLDTIRSRINRLLQTADQGRLFREGVRTAIVGEPNVGKSSLLNKLLGYERAIVSNIPGTTRDTVEESVLVGGLALRLVDTAGVRDAKDLIEQAGIERTSKAIASSDLILEVVDASQPQEANQRVSLPEGIPSLLILNKCDLSEHPSWASTEGVRFSCQQDAGKQELEQAIWKIFANRFPQSDGQSLASINARHQEALRRCVASLDQAEASLLRQDSPELTALDLREAMEALGELTGKIDTEDILGAIFSTFCIGK
jgi:tRNA modification GTPase